MLTRSSLVILLVAATAACDKVPLGAPRESSITVSAPTRALAMGATTEISASVVEPSGTPVQNGTTVRFTTTLGRVEPADALTRNGVAVTTLHAGNVSGVAQVTATSGAGTGGTGTTATNVVEIQIGAGAAAAVVVSASPSTVPPSGGTVTLTASVVDGSGNRLGAIPVTFSSTAGTLSASLASTNDNGDAVVTLTTNRQANVTARVGSGEGARTSPALTINVATANSVALAVAPATQVVGLPVILTVTPTVGANNTAPRVVINWGDGASEDIGLVSVARTVAHVYGSTGTFTIAATATGEGETATASTAVTINPRPAVSVAVEASDSAPTTDETVTFTATVTEGGVASSVASYQWVVDSNMSNENQTVTTTGNMFTRSFATAGAKTVTVTATTTDGRSGVGQTQVNVP
jgi:hypothetical protein